MASPQIEHGFTRIANELIEAFYKTKMTGIQFCILLLIVRESYGWRRKKTGPMGLGAMSLKTGAARSSIQKAVSGLRVLGVISGDRQGWSVKKDYEKWVGGGTPQRTPTVRPSVHPRTPQRTPTVRPSVHLRPISSTGDIVPKEIKEKQIKKRKKTTAPAAVDFSEYRIKYLGGCKGRPIVEVPVDTARFLLANGRPGPEDRAALLWRIADKRSDMTQAQRMVYP